MSPRVPLVYIAGPYTEPDPVTNTRQAVEMGLEIRSRLGVAVIIPHTSMLSDLMFPQELDYWYKYDLDILHACDAVIRLIGYSEGADREVEFALEERIPVFNLSQASDWEDLQKWRARWYEMHQV